MFELLVHVVFIGGLVVTVIAMLALVFDAVSNGVLSKRWPR